MGRGDLQGSVEGWCVIADSSQVGSRLPLTAERFGESVVLWRDPEGSVMGSRVRPDEGLEESSDTDEALVVHEAKGWIWSWRGHGDPDRAAFEGPGEVDVGDPDSLSSHVWHMPVHQAIEATRRARPSTTLLGPNLCADTVGRHIGIVVAFVALDDRRTEVLVRSRTRRADVTGLGWLMTSMMQRRARRVLNRPPSPGPERYATPPSRARSEAS